MSGAKGGVGLNNVVVATAAVPVISAAVVVVAGTMAAVLVAKGMARMARGAVNKLDQYAREDLNRQQAKMSRLTGKPAGKSTTLHEASQISGAETREPERGQQLRGGQIPARSDGNPAKPAYSGRRKPRTQKLRKPGHDRGSRRLSRESQCNGQRRCRQDRKPAQASPADDTETLAREIAVLLPRMQPCYPKRLKKYSKRLTTQRRTTEILRRKKKTDPQSPYRPDTGQQLSKKIG